MNYPLSFRFKLLALTPQIYVTDASGREVCYVKQKMFRLREKIEVHADSSRQQLLCTIEADRIIDVRTRFSFKDTSGRELAVFRRRGMRSIWRTNCEIYAPGGSEPIYLINEEKPFIKLIDGIIDSIPIVGFVSGYLFHPSYLLSRADGTPVMRLTKQAAFFEGLFLLEKIADITPEEETVTTLAFLMMNLLERSRG